ncbi:MAG: alpha/beta fold hydrolase [Lyngbya sp. HA4199-MV5]|jgi:hypothetical protein|nr:alpha/beta fold hydrolase [Lyngbya sp. HA4199-MV5]
MVFFVLNLLAFTGAYALTHFSAPGHFSVGLPRPSSSKRPIEVGLEYTTQRIAISQTEWLETWLIPVQTSPSQGTVLLFPGNGGSKAKQLLAPAKSFHTLGYDTLLVDFRGVGGSSGNTTTLGAREANDVVVAMQYAQRLKLKRPIVLYGVSMGTGAILKAIAQKEIQPDAVILELPFTRLLDAVRSRLRAVHVPTFPLAELLVFWGSVQHQLNGFTHNPVMYASQVKCPALLLQGERDRWTSLTEINQIVQNLHGFKKLVIFPTAGHDLLVTVDQNLWKQSVKHFLKEI